MKWPALILITISLILLAVYGSGEKSNSRYNETKEMIVLRKVVHELMLSSGDSASRVLPVKEVSADEFYVYPEKPLSIQPDSLVNIIGKTVKEGKLLRNFTVNVVKSRNKEVVYGLAASAVAKENVITCKGRRLPEDQYYLDFIFSSKQIPTPWSRWLYTGVAMLAAGLCLFFLWKRKDKNESPVAVTGTAVTVNEANPNHIHIGKYIFSPEQQWLELNGDKVTLTIKECKVLAILANAPNTIVERETLQKEVWENEGVIVTRSLDMFISKLRKKLGDDPTVKIVNVHGKGYKLSTSDN
jgi:DNA-binding winged helix-turn-helix (wHTH) protein